jgi:HK97 family phage prohead protease
MNKITSILEVKELKPSGVFAGYGSVFGVKDRHGDIVDRGAFFKSLNNHRRNGSGPALLLYHDPTQPVGKYRSIVEDDHGLYVEGTLSMGTPKGSEAYELLKSGALGGLSIGYIPTETKYDQRGKANHIIEADLLEISLVTLPANPEAVVTSVKNFSTPREFEQFLVANGLSRNMAKSIAVGGFRGASGSLDDDVMRQVEVSLLQNIKMLSAGVFFQLKNCQGDKRN